MSMEEKSALDQIKERGFVPSDDRAVLRAKHARFVRLNADKGLAIIKHDDRRVRIPIRKLDSIHHEVSNHGES